MSTSVLGVLFVLGVVAGAVVLGLIHTGIERVIAKHRRRSPEPGFRQTSHVRVTTREESTR